MSEKQSIAPSKAQSSGNKISADERRLVRKIDFRLIPCLILIFLFSFLDKVNISNARIFHLEADLGLHGTQFNSALVIYFCAYVVFDVPMTVAMRRVRPHTWLSLCTFSFGVVAMCQGFVHSYGALLAVRFLLGIAEAGSFSCCFYLISMWYKRSEAQRRFTFFYSSTNLAGAFGGLLASAIGLMDGLRGYSGWRWIFIIEGAVTAVYGVLLFVLLPDFPEQSTWLNVREKELAVQRLKDELNGPSTHPETDSSDHETTDHKPLTLKTAISIIVEPKTLVGGLMYFCLVLVGYGYAYFAPTIIHTFTADAITTQLLSVPPWVAAFLTAMLTAYLSDTLSHRWLFTLVPSAISVAGLCMLLALPPPAAPQPQNHGGGGGSVQYAALFLVSIGIWSPLPVLVCWFSMNVAGRDRRAVAIGWQIAFGNVAGVPAVFLFVSSQSPRFVTGYAVSLAFTVLAALASTAYWWLCRRQNGRKMEELRQLAEGSSDAEKEFVAVVVDDRSLGFMNML